ncbi:NAD(P)-dependent alcohol dehydrogenase [candidate division KSB1 bacterium]|nr:NAD(P)-dependent alcohol dehydrogenase [candidate division KSB1 bacterium]
MKACLHNKYGPPEVVQLIDVTKPVPGDEEILIKIYATTVTAVDAIFRKGDQFFARMATGPFRPKISTLGSEFSGVVEAVGKNVKSFKAGDAVLGDSSTGFGTHAEYLCIAEGEPIIAKPAQLSFEEAAAVPYGALTALPFLRDNAKIRKGQNVLINGASGTIGSYAVLFAKYFGAKVTGVCSSANIELVRALGAEEVIDYTKADFTEKKETYDVIFDTVGKSSFSRCKSALKTNGIYLTTVVGFPILLQMLWTTMAGTKKAIVAFTGLRPAEEKLKDLQFVSELIEGGRLKPLVDKRFSLEEIAGAHAYVEQGHKKGSVAITVHVEK